MKYLFLENKKGKVIRTFLCDKIPLFAIRRRDTGRFELWTDQTFKTNKSIPVQVLSFMPEEISKEGLSIPFVGILKQGEYSKQLQYDIKPGLQDLQHSYFYMQSCFFIFLIFGFIGLILNVPIDVKQVKEEFQVNIVQPQNKTKKLIIKNPFDRYTEKTTVSIKKSNTLSNNKLNELLAIRDNTQKLKISLGSVFSLDNDIPDRSKKTQNHVGQEVYDKSVFSASSASSKLESTGGYVKASEKNQSYGDISLLSNNSSSSQSKQTGYQGGLSFEQQRALHAFISKEEGVLRRCYERGLQAFSEFKGDIYLSWKIDKKGKAQSVRVAKLLMNKNSSINLNEFKECIMDHIKSWSFPLILNEETIAYTFQFQPSI